MGKKRLTPLATALTLVDELSESDQATLIDYLRNKQPKAQRANGSGKSAPKAAPAVSKRSPRGRQTDTPSLNLETGSDNAGDAAAN